MIALLLLAPFLAGQSIATEPFSVLKRHHDDDAFVPGIIPGCPDDWPMCGDSGICYNPDEGQTCCPGGTYACPSSSFCLFDPYCCPNNIDAESCAREYGLALTTSQLPNNPQSSSEPSSDESVTIDPLYPRPTLPPSTSASSITIISTPIPTPVSSLIPPWPSSSVAPSPEGDGPFPGGAVRNLDLNGVGLGVVGGLGLGLVLGWLI
ncbi:hypothetical protein BDW59DRAFT_124141 [Aspergillus cavernicola]|uniref:Granulins domain-containing protein n=1 Tax=Aspergillus cavernicola TaxID=176166 RepID=A0ABR4IVD5_9EURO